MIIEVYLRNDENDQGVYFCKKYGHTLNLIALTGFGHILADEFKSVKAEVEAKGVDLVFMGYVPYGE